MPNWNIIQAVNDALRLEMRLDPRVVVLGEDVGKFGGVFRATLGLIEEFGADRVIDTPLAEAGIIGAAIGMALNGLRPVPEIQFSDFIFPAFDQIVNELAKFRYRSGGQYSAPVVIPHSGRRRHQGRPLPLAVARGALHPHARPASGLSLESDRCEGAPPLLHAAERSGPLHGAEAGLSRRRRRGSSRATTRLPLGEARRSRARGAGSP